MEFDTQVKVAIYHHFAQTGRRPSPAEVAERVGADRQSVLDAYQSLRSQRLLVLEPDGDSIRMAPPFSGIPTQHRIEAGGRSYFANCAWDTLGVVAALQTSATVHSRCEQSGQPFNLNVNTNGPEPSEWLFHCLVPAAKWWHDIVFT